MILADPNVGSDLDGAQLHLFGDLLLLGRIGFVAEGVAQSFHFRVARPARGRGVAIGREESRRDRVEDVGRRPGGQEGIPAALAHRHLLGAPSNDRLPVHVHHVDLEAAALEQRLCYGCQIGERLKIGRVHQQHRHAVVAGLGEQLL